MKRVREHIVKLRLSQRENEVIDAIVKKNGGQKAALVREMVMKEVLKRLQPAQ